MKAHPDLNVLLSHISISGGYVQYDSSVSEFVTPSQVEAHVAEGWYKCTVAVGVRTVGSSKTLSIVMPYALATSLTSTTTFPGPLTHPFLVVLHTNWEVTDTNRDDRANALFGENGFLNSSVLLSLSPYQTGVTLDTLKHSSYDGISSLVKGVRFKKVVDQTDFSYEYGSQVNIASSVNDPLTFTVQYGQGHKADALIMNIYPLQPTVFAGDTNGGIDYVTVNFVEGASYRYNIEET